MALADPNMFSVLEERQAATGSQKFACLWLGQDVQIIKKAGADRFFG